MSRRKYTKEFKIEAVRLVEESDVPVFDVARELGVHPNSLYKWRRQYLADGEEAFPGHGILAAGDDEVRQLRRELARVREERDILKKALAFFSRESR
jgi:transposase